MALARQIGSPIRRILLTHAHGDHVGSVDQLAGLLGKAVRLAALLCDARAHTRPLQPNIATGHRPTARRAVEQLITAVLAGIPVRRVAPGHGRVLDGGNNLLQAALASAK